MKCAYLHVTRGENPSQRWCIRHRASGVIVLRGYRSRAKAAAERDYICSLTDWSRTAEQLAADHALRAVMLGEQVRVAHGRPAIESGLAIAATG